MGVIMAGKKGGGLFSNIGSLIALAAAPFTAGTSLAWLPGAIGLANGIAKGDPIGAIAGGLGAGMGGLFGSGVQGALGNVFGGASTAGNINNADFDAAHQGALNSMTAGTSLAGSTITPAATAANTAAQGSGLFNGQKLWETFQKGSMAGMFNQQDQPSMITTNGAQHPVYQTTNSLGLLSKKNMEQ